jgi:LacI family transcriptional regulator
MVFLNRRSPVRRKGPYVGIDNAKAGQAVGTHFAECGYRRVAIFHGPMTSSATRGRVNGFQASFGVATAGHGQVRLCRATVDRKRSGYLLAARLLEEGRPPDAIFCTTDEIAYGAAKQCQERGLRVPQDIALFGFDGNPLNDYLAPWLSTVHVPYEEFGPAAASLLRRWRHDGAPPTEDIILPFRMVIAPPL